MNEIYVDGSDDVMTAVIRTNFKIGDVIRIRFDNGRCIVRLASLNVVEGSIFAMYGINVNHRVLSEHKFGVRGNYLRLATLDEIDELNTYVISYGHSEIETEIETITKRKSMELSDFKFGNFVTITFDNGKYPIIALVNSVGEMGNNAIKGVYAITGMDRFEVNGTYGFHHGDIIRYSTDEERAMLLKRVDAYSHKEKKVKRTITIVEEEVWE